MKKLKLSLLIGLCLSVNLLHAQSLKPKIGDAPTPPMGWNSYNCYGATVEEAEVKANAQYLAKNMKQYGWQYVVIDFCWFYPHPPGSHQDNPPQFQLPKGGLVPWMPMDKNGRLLPDPRKFPSSAGGKGFKPLADYVHSRLMGTSRTVLYSKVSALTGKSVGEFIRKMRLQTAAKILVTEKLPVNLVMDRVGIQSASYFAKAFKKEFGKTPSQYLLDFTADNKREGKIDLAKEDPSVLN